MEIIMSDLPENLAFLDEEKNTAMSVNPYQTPSVMGYNHSQTGLGSIVQSEMIKQLRTAKIVLLIVGVLSVVVNAGFMIYLSDRLSPLGYTIFIASILEGVAFIVLGLLVYRYPVPATLLGLILYVADKVVCGVINPESIPQGLLVKIIVIVLLVIAVRTAFSYQKTFVAKLR
jgi:hypothetical protein